MSHVKELTLRVRANEKVVAIDSAIGIGAGGIVGTTAFAPKVDASEAVVPSYKHGDKVIVVQSDPIPGTPLGVPRGEYPEYLEPRGHAPYAGMLPDNASGANAWIQKMRNWKAEQERLPIEEMLNKALADIEWEEEDGSNDPTEQKVLLQFPSNDN